MHWRLFGGRSYDQNLAFLDLARSFEVEYLLLERFESLLLSIWIMQIFATFSIAFIALRSEFLKF